MDSEQKDIFMYKPKWMMIQIFLRQTKILFSALSSYILLHPLVLVPHPHDDWSHLWVLPSFVFHVLVHQTVKDSVADCFVSIHVISRARISRPLRRVQHLQHNKILENNNGDNLPA